jgi:nucleotide-sensitive chloride channel 1A
VLYLFYAQENTAVYLNRKSLGMGTLYISDSRVSWVGIAGQGFSLEYPHIAVHAVSRDLTQFHQVPSSV